MVAGSLIISEPRNATVRCAVPCELASVHRVGFTQILDRIGGKERERRKRLTQRRQMEQKRTARARAKEERAQARAKAGRKRPEGRRRRFSAIDDWSAEMEVEAEQRSKGKPARLEEGGDLSPTVRQAVSGVKKRVRRASVEMFKKVKETVTTDYSAPASPKAAAAGSADDCSSSSSEDEFDEPDASKFTSNPAVAWDVSACLDRILPITDDDDSTPASSPRSRRGSGSSGGTTSPSSPKSPTARALGGVRQHVRRASVTMMGAVSKVKQVLVRTQASRPLHA